MKHRIIPMLVIAFMITCTDLFSQWVQSINIPNQIVKGVVKCRDKFFAGTSTGHFDAGQLYSSTNNGLTWSLVNVGFGFSGVFSMAVRGDYIYVGTYEDGLLMSSDAGQSWVLNGVNNIWGNGVFGVGVSGSSNVIAYTNTGTALYLSTNHGVNWSSVNPGGQISQLRTFADLPGKFFAGSRKGVAMSTNNGANWTLQGNNGLPQNPDGTKPVTAICYHNGKLYAGCINKIFVSTDFGNNFAPTNFQLSNFEYSTSFASYGNKLFAGLYIFQSATPAVLMTTDEGSNWIDYENTGFPHKSVYSLCISDDYLIAGTSLYGIWIFPLEKYTLTLTINFEASQTADTINAELHSASPPYNLIETTKAIAGGGVPEQLNFINSSNGTPYYISVRQRNSIEVWSSKPQTFTSGNLNYNFTTSSSQAFGNNLVNISGLWSMYSADVNQDGAVDLTDVGQIENDAANFASGYVSTDVNNDGTVDVSDAMYADNNSFNFVHKISP